MSSGFSPSCPRSSRSGSVGAGRLSRSRPDWNSHPAGRCARYRIRQRIPPVICRASPVIHAESEDARNTAAGAMSCGWPMRPGGVLSPDPSAEGIETYAWRHVPAGGGLCGQDSQGYLDMVGRLGDRPLGVGGVATGSGLRTVVDDAGRQLGIALAHSDAPGGASDHAAFYSAGVPVLSFHTGVHPDYHRPTDTGSATSHMPRSLRWYSECERSSNGIFRRERYSVCRRRSVCFEARDRRLRLAVQRLSSSLMWQAARSGFFHSD
jgi:Peptidase family M28